MKTRKKDIFDEAIELTKESVKEQIKALQHTPGPWKYHVGRGAEPRFHIQTEGGYQIASTTELVRHPQAYEENEAREANARLIAAAPELLEALKWLLPVFKHPEWKDAEMQMRIDGALKVIAKAEGR